MQKPKRVNKSKEELAKQMKYLQELEHQKKLARAMFPILESQKTIYDAQTVVNALAGFIKADMEDKIAELKVSDLEINLKKEEDGSIKTAILKLRELFNKESADDAAKLLERFGAGLGQYGAKKYLENPMSEIKMEDFVA